MAARYEVRVIAVGREDTEPIEVGKEDFRAAIQMLAHQVGASEDPQETARWLLEEALQADLLAEVESGRVVRMTPLDEDSPLSTNAAQLAAGYQLFCKQQYGGGDCLGLLADGPTLDRADRRTLALALAFGSVLQETRQALQQMVSPQAVLTLLVWTAALYFTLWLVPEPVTKGVAALMTVAFIAWLGASTLWKLMDGWARLVHEADRATSFEQLRESGHEFSKLMGDHTARTLLLVVTAALGGGATRFSQNLPKLPGVERAAAQAQTQGGLRLAAASEVETVAAPAESTFTLMIRNPSGRAAATAEARTGATILIRHQGGNRQILIRGQRWHVPADRSIKEVPTKDLVGDQLQAAAERAARNWSPGHLTAAERNAIRNARSEGRHLEANLWERMYRGRWVENQLRREFPRLQWSPKGVDAMDPTTGLRYEILSGTSSNMELHGRRMAEEFFRLITF
ncbi:hypothetical protein [Hyalangium rubrum]|uniref:Lipoprotein n=1 Tax=Hyalangium rubrum TaxID=3103134 RepID=A0ABU5H0F6_9BACT|nr:hypothetical protein [Hyalangium sp. s54d21]MDY7226409.1 hypothetical protein [Hyalangium sp. s54d21]